MDINIKIAPFLIPSWFISFEKSYKWGTELNIIYTPRFTASYICAEIENGPDFIKETCKHITHETIHLWLFQEENKETSKAWDNLDKNEQTNTYNITS